MSLMRRIKRGIIKSGIPPSSKIDFFNALLSLGRWLRENPAPVHFEQREKLYDYVAGKLNGEPFDYLEAGVYHGDSIRYWAKLSGCPASRFYGFDTFTGLPEAWQTGLAKIAAGQFSAGGVLPAIDDGRVQFIKGRFQDTVPDFLRMFSPQKKLVIHCDADIYSSTLYFLTAFHAVMPEETYILFDNFSVAPHDFRAFCDYTQAYCRTFDVLGTAEVDFEKIAFRLT